MASFRFKMVGVFLLLLSLCAILSCNKNKSKNIISEKKIIPLMVDLLLLEANYSLLNPQSYNVKSEMMDSLYGLIFKKHHADSIAYKNSIEYYSETPNHYIEIMESVKARLSSIDSVAQIKYGKEHEATMPINPLDIQKALRDSIKLAKKKELKERFKNNNHTQ